MNLSLFQFCRFFENTTFFMDILYCKTIKNASPQRIFLGKHCIKLASRLRAKPSGELCSVFL
ncbi:hypothetical protein RUMCAL_03123 [Ruminococcus callidus ATCC 27760]|uniref:Uncharacterized protein n=1 Tax=Ruminococcus callidus ATCC 27760 TaxID=411473 RepID=U2LNH3_9FIRM|nr:hypothetical protein RUMCAL_03123 [Ruminococcus callidus ATCC 27760]